MRSTNSSKVLAFLLFIYFYLLSLSPFLGKDDVAGQVQQIYLSTMVSLVKLQIIYSILQAFLHLSSLVLLRQVQ